MINVLCSITVIGYFSNLSEFEKHNDLESTNIYKL